MTSAPAVAAADRCVLPAAAAVPPGPTAAPANVLGVRAVASAGEEAEGPVLIMSDCTYACKSM